MISTAAPFGDIGNPGASPSRPKSKWEFPKIGDPNILLMDKILHYPL